MREIIIIKLAFSVFTTRPAVHSQQGISILKCMHNLFFVDYIGLSLYLALATATLIIWIVYIALHTKGVLTLKDLILPSIAEIPMSAEIALILLHPLFWILSLGICSLFLVSLLFTTQQQLIAYDWLMFAFSLIIFFALFDPFTVWLLEGRLREPLRFIMGSMSYGVLCALAAFFINSFLGIWLNEFIDPTLGAIVLLSLVPFLEEILKMVGVVAFTGHRLFRGPLDGLLIGFSIGAGFALTENLFYIITKIPAYSLDLLIFRALYNTIAHGAFTAIGGAVLGKIKVNFGSMSLLLVSTAVFIAALVHTAFNILAIVDIVGVKSLVLNYYIFSPLLVIALIIVVVYLIYYSKKSARASEVIEKKTENSSMQKE